MNKDYTPIIIAIMGFTLIAISLLAGLTLEETKETESITTECEVVDKDTHTRIITNGKVSSTVTEYYLTVDINGDLEEVPVTSSVYDQIEIPCSTLFTLFYNKENELIKAALY